MAPNEHAFVLNTRLVRLSSYDSPLAADAARLVLEREGISARLDGESVGHALNHVGTALGGVGLLVAEGDAVRAAEIIAELAREAKLEKAPWFCGRCREDVEATFDVCWSCGKDRAEVEVHAPPVAIEADGRFAANSTEATRDYHSRHDAETEALLARAWRASIVGIVFLPVILHLYSMWLLLRASTSGHSFSPEGSRKFYQAFAVNVLAGLVWGMGFLWMLQ